MTHDLMKWIVVTTVFLACGCSTTNRTNTARTGVEQLLISTAIDTSLEKIDFRPFAGTGVFLQDKYLDGVDKQYLIATVREKLLEAGASIAPAAENADVVMEIRSGGVGTNTTDTFLGSPALAVPGPFPIQLPEVRLLGRTTQSGIAKIGLVAYDAKTGDVLGKGGTSVAVTDDNNWLVAGVGPFKSGTVKDELARADSNSPVTGKMIPTVVGQNRPKKTVPRFEIARETAPPAEEAGGVSRVSHSAP